MAVWLTMNMSHAGSGDSANTAKIYVTVDVHWDAKHYNRDGGSLKVTIDGTTFSYTVPFNANETSSGSERLHTSIITVPHSSSRTVYGSATFQATNATTATPASAQVTLTGSGGSGGSSGGDSGGNSGDSGDDDDDGGGDSGSGSGGSGGDYTHYLSLDCDLDHYCFIKLYRNGTYIGNIYGLEYILKKETSHTYYTIELVVDDGYKLGSFTVDGRSYADTRTVTLETNTNGSLGDYTIIASLEPDVSDSDGFGWLNGDEYDANVPPFDEGKSTDGSGYILVRQAEGTKLTVTRTSVYDDSYYEQGDYIGELVNGELIRDEYGTWYKYKAWNFDYFAIEVESLPGYVIDKHNVDGIPRNIFVSGMYYDEEYDEWAFSGYLGSEVARIYTAATKIVDSGKYYGSGSGTLYFDVGEYEDQLAVEFVYGNNKFYVTSVKAMEPKTVSIYSVTYDLLIKINDAVIWRGEETFSFDPYTPGWIDLNINGYAGITDDVKITLAGTLSPTYTDDEYSISTVKTILINSTDSGGNDPVERDPIPTTVVGQVTLTKAINTPAYSSSYNGSVNCKESSAVISLIKFITPDIDEGSTALSVSLSGVTLQNISGGGSQTPSLCAAICTSDENNGLYFKATPTVDDPYQLSSRLMTYDEYSQEFLINTDQLESNRTYYLILWIPGDETGTKGIRYNPSPNHTIQVYYGAVEDQDARYLWVKVEEGIHISVYQFQNINGSIEYVDISDTGTEQRYDDSLWLVYQVHIYDYFRFNVETLPGYTAGELSFSGLVYDEDYGDWGFNPDISDNAYVWTGTIDDSTDDNTVNIVVASGFESFTIFIDTNGTGFEEYVAYIGNGVTFEPYH